LTISEASKVLDVRRATLSDLINGLAALTAEMALQIEKAFGVKMETLLNMQAWHDAYAMRQREGEIAVKPYRPPAPEPCRSASNSISAHILCPPGLSIGVTDKSLS
jgi:antitoxin HigA-1